MKNVNTLLFLLITFAAHAQGVGDAKQISVSISAEGTTLSGAGFVIGDVGKIIIIHQAGQYGDELTATVTGYTSATQMVLYCSAFTTVANATAWIGTDNAPLFQSAIESNKTINLQSCGRYLFSGKVTLQSLSNVQINGNGAELLFVSANPNSYITGSQPTKDLFRVNSCDRVGFDRITFRNIGQEQPRTDTNSEGRYYTQLNGVAVSYSRHFNKTANSGACVCNTDSKRVSVTNCSAYRAGSLYKTSGSAAKCTITGNTVVGYGTVAFYPGAESYFAGNMVDNSEAAIVTDSEANYGYGTSHAYYITSGFDGVKIIGENVIGCRHYTIQFNTASQNSASRSIISNCTFSGCSGWLYVAGTSPAFNLIASNLVAVNSKNANVVQQNAVVLFSNILLDNSTITISSAKSVEIIDCYAKNLPSSNISAVYVVPYTIGTVRIKNCTFSESVATGIYFHGDGQNINSLDVQNCTFHCISKLGYSGLTPFAGASKKIAFNDCNFYGEGLSIYMPCRVIGCKFFLVEGVWGITVLHKAGALLIEKSVFITDFGPHSINLAPMPAGGTCEIIANDFGENASVNYGANSFSKNYGNKWWPN